jgi:hypothetical protein
MKSLRALSLGGAVVIAALLTSSASALSATADDSVSNSSGNHQVNFIANDGTLNHQSDAQQSEVSVGAVPPGTFHHLVKAGTRNCLQSTGTVGQQPIVAPCVTSGPNLSRQLWLRFEPTHITQFENQAFRGLCLQAARTVNAVLEATCHPNPDINPATSRDSQVWIPIRDGSQNVFDAGFVNAETRDRCLGQSGATATLVPCTNVSAPLWHWGYPAPALTATYPGAAVS